MINCTIFNTDHWSVPSYILILFFRKVGAILKEKFDGATEVKVELKESKPIITRRDLQFKKHTKADLVSWLNYA